MTLSLADRVFETTATTGTGTVNLAGSLTGFQTFIAGVGTGKKVPYQIDDGTNWEVGVGTVTSGSPDTLSRTTILASSNANAAVNFGAGTKNVRLGFLARVMPPLDENLNFVQGFGTAGGTANAQTITLSPAPLGLSDGMEVWAYMSIANTTAAWTLNVNSTGNKSVKLNGADGPVGMSASGKLMGFRYKLSDTTWQVINPMGELSAQSRNRTFADNQTITTVASAATTADLWTNTGEFIDYTGTTTSTNFAAAPQAGSQRTLICAGISTFTNNANLIIDGGANFTSAAGDRVIVTALTTTTFRLQPIKADGNSIVPGKVLQVVSATSTSSASSTSIIPRDGTIPQNTEGTQFLTATIVPKSASSRIRAEVMIPIGSNSGNGFSGAMFRDSTANAIQAGGGPISNTVPGQCYLLADVASGSTASTDFKFRFGPSEGAGTAYVNGLSGTGYSTANVAIIMLTEYLP